MDLDALAAWEAEQSVKETRRVYKTSKRSVDPRREKQRDFRNATCRRFYGNKEEAWMKVWIVRRFRRFLKRNLENEAYDHTRNRDYRTYGWLTW